MFGPASSLTPGLRRALALAELKRRGARLNQDDGRQTAAHVALREALSHPKHSSIEVPVMELSDRIDAGTMTDADKTMLRGLPPCDLTPVELVKLVAELYREF